MRKSQIRFKKFQNLKAGNSHFNSGILHHAFKKSITRRSLLEEMVVMGHKGAGFRVNRPITGVISLGRQLGFKELKAPSRKFGGSLLGPSHAKVRRTLDSKLPIHLVLRSNKSRMLLPKNFAKIELVIDATVKKHGLTLYKKANVGNHIHFVLRMKHRRQWAAFIRELTGRIAMIAGRAGERFWAALPFTEVVGSWRTAFQQLLQYVTLNQWEADGHIDRADIKRWKDLRKIFGDEYFNGVVRTG